MLKENDTSIQIEYLQNTWDINCHHIAFLIKCLQKFYNNWERAFKCVKCIAYNVHISVMQSNIQMQ